MLAGHYSVSYVVKKVDSSIPLWHLFLAVQFMDIVWSLLILLGVEKADTQVVLPGSPIHLTYMPYTHSLVGSLCLSLLVFFAYRWLPLYKGSARNRAALLVGMAVFSHWVLDLIVHDADLPMIGNLFKVGFGLYHSAIWSYVLEGVLLVGSVLLWMRQTPRGKKSGRESMAVVVIVLMLINAMATWGFKPPSAQFVAVFNFLYYVTFAFVIARWERNRKQVTVPQNRISA
jgi:hypothetical protein